MLQESKSQHEDEPLQAQKDVDDNSLENEMELLKLEEQVKVEAQPNQLEVSNFMISKEHFN
jgi:hypothetical protein